MKTGRCRVNAETSRAEPGQPLLFPAFGAREDRGLRGGQFPGPRSGTMPVHALARADVGLGIRPAGVVDVACDILAHRAVDSPAAVQLEQVLVLDRVVLLVPGIEQRPEIADDLGPLLDRLGGKQAKSGTGAANAV